MPGSLDATRVRQILRGAAACAVQAPSSHNTQPWRFRLHADGLEISLDRSRQMLDLKVFVNETRLAQNLAVVKTPPGHASAVARAIDMLEFEGLVGSVAGDDTVLCVLHDTATAKRFKRHLDSIAQTTGGAQ